VCLATLALFLLADSIGLIRCPRSAKKLAVFTAWHCQLKFMKKKIINLDKMNPLLIIWLVNERSY
jgi:hypothetical protein